MKKLNSLETYDMKHNDSIVRKDERNFLGYEHDAVRIQSYRSDRTDWYLVVVDMGNWTKYKLYEEEYGIGVVELDDEGSRILGSFTKFGEFSSKNHDSCFHYDGEYEDTDSLFHICGRLDAYIELLQFIQADNEAKVHNNAHYTKKDN